MTWMLELDLTNQKAGIQPAFQAPFQGVVTFPLPTPLGMNQIFVYVSLRVFSLALLGFSTWPTLLGVVFRGKRRWSFFYLRSTFLT
jgi:hypothetical protein